MSLQELLPLANEIIVIKTLNEIPFTGISFSTCLKNFLLYHYYACRINNKNILFIDEIKKENQNKK